MTPLLLLLLQQQKLHQRHQRHQRQRRRQRILVITIPQIMHKAVLALLFLLLCCCNNANNCEAFIVGVGAGVRDCVVGVGVVNTKTISTTNNNNNNNNNNSGRRRGFTSSASTSTSTSSTSLYMSNNNINNLYDNWRSDAVVDTMHLDEDNVIECLNEFIQSDYGTTMFGCHERASSIGITGYIEFIELCGPTVTLRLSNNNDCKFWHKRSFVLGRAAVWLNARIPEITNVIVDDIEELNDFKDIVDELSGEVLYKKDKRSEDFNGDRYTMEYQGYVYYVVTVITPYSIVLYCIVLYMCNFLLLFSVYNSTVLRTILSLLVSLLTYFFHKKIHVHCTVWILI
jgi:hypothetical protein